MEKDNKKLINAWSSYDWANSVYNLIITTAIFPIYYSDVTEKAFGGKMVEFFGISIDSSVLFTYAISCSFLVVVLCSPILSGIADYTGSKKRFMQFFTYLGSFSCMGLYFFEGSNVEYGISCSVLASIGYAGSLVFYNGFLPEVASPERMDNVSARGFTFGYIGSVILLIISLIIIMKPEMTGFSDSITATKSCFLMVGIWWLVFAQIAFYYLKDRKTGNTVNMKVLGKGISELKKVLAAIKGRPVMKRYLLSFFFYSMGVLTVMLLAPLFGRTEVGVGAEEMIIVVLLLQILAIFGAYFFVWVSQRRGSRFSISMILLIWILICITCYFLKVKTGFYVLAGLVGFGMGGVQSISRSTYSRLIPKTTKDTASYFSFYDITEKLAIVIGTFSYGLINQFTGSMRNSMLFMSIFFIVGFIILQMTDLQSEMQKVSEEEESDNPWDDIIEDILDS
jgi:MFS transporter, UMF1 family